MPRKPIPKPAPPPGTVRLARADDAGHQLAIMEFLSSFIAEHGYSPTIVEIGQHINRTRPTVLKHLDALESVGLIKRAPRNRAITIVADE